MQILCTRSSCSFRVHDRYFVDKTRFQVGICPVDGGPLKVVHNDTDNEANAQLDKDPNSSTYRRVIGADAEVVA